MKYFVDWIIARDQLHSLHTSMPELRETWRIEYLIFANMGGFALQYETGPEDDLSMPTNPDTECKAGVSGTCRIREVSGTIDQASKHMESREKSGSAASYMAANDVGIDALGQHQSKTPSDASSHRVDTTSRCETRSSNEAVATADSQCMKRRQREHSLWYLTSKNLISAIERGHLPSNTATVEDIRDKSNSDSFAKSLITLQTGYFVLTIVVRASNDLPITLLELGTAGYVACSILTYVVCYSRPKSISTPIIIQTYNRELPNHILDLHRELQRSGLLSGKVKHSSHIRNDEFIHRNSDAP